MDPILDDFARSLTREAREAIDGVFGAHGEAEHFLIALVTLPETMAMHPVDRIRALRECLGRYCPSPA